MNGESNNIPHSASFTSEVKATRSIHADYAAWPPRLQCAYDICMQSTLPMCICFAQGMRLLYNAAWAALLGTDSSPGDVGSTIYGEQWASIDAALSRAIDSGTTLRYDRTLFGKAHRGMHDGFFNYQLQPLSVEDGAIVLVSAERSYEDVEKNHDEFLATIAHELRNPFGALAAAAQVLNKAIDRPQMMATAREALTRQVGYLSQLLDNLLDISRVRRGRLELRPQPVSLKDVIAASMQAAGPALENRQHNVVVEQLDTVLRVSGDKHLLIRAFATLLSFVAKHTESGRPLQLQATPHESEVDIVISNTSFAPDVIQRAITDCLEKKITRQPGKDTDLALYLVCGLVQLHGGGLSVQRNAEGNGTDIVMTLPRIHVHDVNQQQASTP
jgi:signal transduction histidine kinase